MSRRSRAQYVAQNLEEARTGGYAVVTAATLCQPPSSSIAAKPLISAGLTPNAVKNALDKGIVPSRDTSDSIDARDVGALVLMRHLGPLGVGDKRRVREWLVNDRRRRFQLTDALVVERTEDVQRKVREARRYAELRDKWIVADQAIRGGDPVIKGSRVSVYTLAERMSHGEPDDVLDDDFPHIPKEARDVAARYARTHPRRGRPRRRGRAA